MSDDSKNHWPHILEEFNAILLDQVCKEPTAEHVVLTGWCGLPAASEAEVQEAERRLGMPLPPSYRSFLRLANGWRPFSHTIERLLPVQQVDWLRVADPERAESIQQYPSDDLSDEEYARYEGSNLEALRTWYYPDCLLIGTAWPSEGEVIVLNPKFTSIDGEWEALFFADWLPGNLRFRSFRDLVSNEIVLDDLQVARRVEGGRAGSRGDQPLSGIRWMGTPREERWRVNSRVWRS